MAAKKQGPIASAKNAVMAKAAPVADAIGNKVSREGRMARMGAANMTKTDPMKVPPVTRKPTPTSGGYDGSEGPAPGGYLKAKK